MASNIAELLGQSLSKASWKPESRGVDKKNPEQKNSGYERPQSLVTLLEKKRHDRSSQQDKSEQNSGYERLKSLVDLFEKKRHGQSSRQNKSDKPDKAAA